MPPPPQPKGPHRDRRSKKRKSSRRTHSENFVGGFAAEAPGHEQGVLLEFNIWLDRQTYGLS